MTLSPDRKIELYYWMRLTRTFDDAMLALWKQGRGVGGTFSQRGHEAISVGSAATLAPDDVIAPMHRDLGQRIFSRGLTPRRIFANLLGRSTGVSAGRDANFHGMGDLDHNLIGFVSHLPQSLGVAVGVAMSFTYRGEARVALTYVGDGSSSHGLFHEALNLAAVRRRTLVLLVENNQYAYSTPLHEQMRNPEIVDRAAGYGIPGVQVDGNDVEAVYTVTAEAVARARGGDGPTLIEAKTLRMLGHAIHDGAEYVPRALLAEWEARDPVALWERRLIEAGILDAEEVEEIGQRCAVEVQDAIDYAESSPLPDPATVTQGVYAE